MYVFYVYVWGPHGGWAVNKVFIIIIIIII